MRIGLASLLVFGGQALACPNLAGDFSCIYKDGSVEHIRVGQEEKDGVTVFQYNNHKIPANNQLYDVPDEDTLRGATFRAWCEGDGNGVLRTQLAGKYYTENSFYGQLTLDTSYRLAGGDLKQISTGVLKHVGGERAINSEVLCKRQ